MVGIASAIIGFLGGVFGGVVAQGLAYHRRKKRHLDSLVSILKEIQNISEHQLDEADDSHAEMTDEHLRKLENELEEARLQASYLLSDEQREKIEKVNRLFGRVSHSTGSSSFSQDNQGLEEEFEEKAGEAIESLPSPFTEIL